MDPLLLEVLRFGTAILAGGLVAVIAQRLAFGHARQLQRDERARRDAGVRRALESEVDENLRRIGDATVRSPTHVERSAWDAARELVLPYNVGDVLAAAYAIGADLNARIAIVDDLLGRGAYADPNSDWNRQATAHHKAQAEEMDRTAARARGAFEKARDELKKMS